MEFEGAELTVYSTDGEMVNLDISRMQLQAVFKVLGFRFQGNGQYICYSDEGLRNEILPRLNWKEA